MRTTASVDTLAAAGGLVGALLDVALLRLRCSLLGRLPRVGLDALATSSCLGRSTVHLQFNLHQRQRVPAVVEPRGARALLAPQRGAALDPPAAAGAGPGGRDPLQDQLRPRADRPLAEGVVGGLEELRIHAGELADPDGEPVDRQRAASRGLRLDALHQRLDEGVLVHQQILGRISPSGSASIRRPSPVSSTTAPGRSATAVAITAARAPSGWARSAARTRSTAPARTPTTAFPSLATRSGSTPRTSHAARTWSVIGTAGSSRTMPTRAFPAISCSTEERPPRVGSLSATTSAPPAASAARTRPLSGATSERRSPSSPRSWRFAMMAMPWSPMVPVTMSRSPGRS